MTGSSRGIGRWLLVVAAFIMAMVVVGGLTRLSRSGLSIVDWKPLTGVLPPIGDVQWQAEYAKYQASPEGRLVNHGMAMEAFQKIFYVEWAHRLLGRVVGLVVLVPFVWLLARRRLSRRLALSILGLLVLGGLQGLAGWLMVKSGLSDRPHVSHFRLTIHLSMALLLFCLTLWVAFGQLWPTTTTTSTPTTTMTTTARGLLRWGVAALVAVAVTIMWGGLVAGTHAGLVAPTFPLMNGDLVPAGLIDATLGPVWSFFEAPLAIQFIHRLLAYLTTCIVLGAAWLARGADVPRWCKVAATAMVVHVVVQVTLGALTVLYFVPISLASLHQVNATLLLGQVVLFVFTARRG